LAEIHFSDARTIVLVQDNLNIHSKASLYHAFVAQEMGDNIQIQREFRMYGVGATIFAPAPKRFLEQNNRERGSSSPGIQRARTAGRPTSAAPTTFSRRSGCRSSRRR
jgi:hypothetical protein